MSRGLGDVYKRQIDRLSTKEEQEAAHQKNRRTQFIVLSTDYSPGSDE